MKRFCTVLVCVVVLAALLVAAGCNTAKGAGKDVEGVGKSMQGE